MVLATMGASSVMNAQSAPRCASSSASAAAAPVFFFGLLLAVFPSAVPSPVAIRLSTSPGCFLRVEVRVGWA